MNGEITQSIDRKYIFIFLAIKKNGQSLRKEMRIDVMNVLLIVLFRWRDHYNHFSTNHFYKDNYRQRTLANVEATEEWKESDYFYTSIHRIAGLRRDANCSYCITGWRKCAVLVDKFGISSKYTNWLWLGRKLLIVHRGRERTTFTLSHPICKIKCGWWIVCFLTRE